ncbi:DUF63 family protein [Natronoarchaeum sp. GCM10025703]|uniref:DUF63 family protein n=1 Tax=unclassified Natronoarchaeum TaxID=2620183 RepID=UPI00361BBBF3
MVVPEGLTIPPLPYLFGLIVGTVGVAGLIYLLQPAVTNWTVVAFGPWMATGGVLHGLEQIGAYPPAITPLFEAPGAYATMAIVTGLAWAFAEIASEIRPHGSADRRLGVIGAAVAVIVVALGLYRGAEIGTFEPFWPVIAIVASVVVAAVAWIVLTLRFTESAAVTGPAGAILVASHAFDGVTTAVGYDVLGAHERTPLSRYVLEAGELLPTADLVGAGWLFILVKVSLAAAIVVLFREFVKDDPVFARLMLAVVAAVGLGPAFNNLLLFTVGV